MIIMSTVELKVFRQTYILLFLSLSVTCFMFSIKLYLKQCHLSESSVPVLLYPANVVALLRLLILIQSARLALQRGGGVLSRVASDKGTFHLQKKKSKGIFLKGVSGWHRKLTFLIRDF